MKIKPLKILALIFLISLAFNLYLSFSSPYLNNDDSYFNLRVVDNIRSTGLPMFYDNLSYGGRPLILQFFFHYLFALLSFVPLYFKIFPSLMISSLVLICYFIAKEITYDETSSLITAFLAGFVPIYSVSLINQFTVYTLVIPLMAFLILCLIRLDEKTYFISFILGSFLLSLTHPSSFLLLLVILFYIILMNVEDLKLTKLKKEALIFIFFLIILIDLLFFSRAFFEYGFNVIHGNNPVSYSFNVFQIFYVMGIVPLLLGIVGLYQGFFKMKKEPIILTSSLILCILFLLLFNLIDINMGLLFLSLGLIISSSLAIRNFFIYLEKTKISNMKNFFIFIILILIFSLSILPTYFNYKKEFTDLSDFEWLKNNVDQDSVILAPLSYGHIITYFTGRRNVIDGNFLLAPNPSERLYNVNLIYDGWSYNKAIELLHEYKVNYIYINKNVKNIYNIQDLRYINDGKCIGKLKEDIYEVIC